MDKSSAMDIPLEEQRKAWNYWNAKHREESTDELNEKQAAVAQRWLAGKSGLEILDAGCGAGWLSGRLMKYGRVTGVDLADEVIARAQQRLPEAKFIAGDFFALELPQAHYDVVACFELLAHVVDQAALVARLARLLKPGGMLILCTQNRAILERCSWIGSPAPGQLRHWLDELEVQRLLAPHFDVEELTSVHPQGNQGVLRIINSGKVARVLDGLTRGGYTSWRESMLLGWSLILKAVRR
jgi:2-polyprenyl-3-methyl-5-hydroxy-6-metoxy-1,4-benzoquinol methylase